MLATVAICTWNRAKLLDQTLASLTHVRVPAGVEWEILVVNNNSPDDTERILNGYRDRLPLRRFLELAQGLSHARNRAIHESRGEHILWLDDDVIVEEHWLESHIAAADAFPDAVVFAGVIEPLFAVPPPPEFATWMPQIGSAFAARQFGPEVRPLRPGEAPYGANFAVRAAIQRRFRFDARVGRVGGSWVGDEESLMLDAIWRAGYSGVWVGTARVQHCMPAERANWNYIWNWRAGVGQSSARRAGVEAVPTLAGLPRWAVVQYWKTRATGFALRQLGRPNWGEHYLRAAHLQGMLTECRRYQRLAGTAEVPSPRAGYLVPPLDRVPEGDAPS